MKNGPHILLCAESGTGKTAFASSIIGSPPALASKQPVLVQLFDPRDKGTAYRRAGDRIAIDSNGYEHVMKGGNEVAIIESWHEREGRAGGGITLKGGSKVQTMKYVLQGDIYERYLERMTHFVEECEDEYFAYIHDSSTFLQHAVMSYLQGVMKVLDNQLVYTQTTDELERFYMATFPDLPITTIVIAHANPQRITEWVDGKKRKARGAPGDVPYEVRLPGRLADDLYATFGEIYRPYYTKKEGYMVQTRRDELWRCQSQLGVDSPLGPNPSFSSVYKQWKVLNTVNGSNKEEEEERKQDLK